MALAAIVRDKPRKIAQVLADNVDDTEQILEKVEIAGPGFMNFFVKEGVWVRLLEEVHRSGRNYGRSSLGAGKRIQVEFVSANPTGPLHVGHARGAVIGDVISNILKATGFDVSKEYYINDVGKQMNTLGKSVLSRYRDICGFKDDFPADFYQGEYICELETRDPAKIRQDLP